MEKAFHVGEVIEFNGDVYRVEDRDDETLTLGNAKTGIESEYPFEHDGDEELVGLPDIDEDGEVMWVGRSEFVMRYDY